MRLDEVDVPVRLGDLPPTLPTQLAEWPLFVMRVGAYVFNPTVPFAIVGALAIALALLSFFMGYTWLGVPPGGGCWP